MKKTILWNGAAVMLLAMAAACSSDDIDELPLEAPEQSRPTMTIIATQGDDTRLAYNPSTDGKQIDMTWTEGDALIVTDATCSAFVELTLAEGAGTNKGTFTTTATLPTTWSSTTELTAHYKANDYVLFSPMDGLTLFMPQAYNNSEFSQTANNSMEHLKATNYMQSGVFTYAAGESVNLKFSQMGTIMKFSLSGMGGQTVKSLKLVADEEAFFYLFQYMIQNGVISSPVTVNEATQTLSFGDAGLPLGDNETLTAYMMLGATELTDGKTITLYAETTTGGIYSATLNGGKLEAGKIYSLSKTMTERTFFAGGTGTEADPYQLSTAQHLKNLNDWINLEFETEGKYFQLQNDIDLSSECGADKGNWIPRIGTDGNSTDSDGVIGFKGTFDGQGHTVKGLYYNDPETDYVGFFGCVAQGGTLKDLHVEGNITASDYSGGVVAKNCGTVSGCTFTGTVATVTYGYGCGGIVGSNGGGTVIGCTNYGTVSSSATSAGTGCYAGGIVGYVNGTNASIIACYNVGTVSGTTYSGSIVGYINYATTPSVIGCYDAINSLNIIGSTNESTVTETANYTNSTTDWAAAIPEMNGPIYQYGWRYVENTDETTKTNEPLKLEKFTPAEPEPAE